MVVIRRTVIAYGIGRYTFTNISDVTIIMTADITIIIIIIIPLHRETDGDKYNTRAYDKPRCYAHYNILRGCTYPLKGNKKLR